MSTTEQYQEKYQELFKTVSDDVAKLIEEFDTIANTDGYIVQVAMKVLIEEGELFTGTTDFKNVTTQEFTITEVALLRSQIEGLFQSIDEHEKELHQGPDKIKKKKINFLFGLLNNVFGIIAENINNVDPDFLNDLNTKSENDFGEILTDILKKGPQA